MQTKIVYIHKNIIQMEFKRERYIQKLEAYKHNHLIKVITGLRRVGKSYLLFRLFRQHLMKNGVEASHIVEIQLDDFAFVEYRKAENMYKFVKECAMRDTGMYYVFIDEVQLLEQFVDVLNGFLHIDNLDVYVTGSNAKFLSSDIVTEFRGRGVQVFVSPLSFKEIMAEKGGEMMSAWKDYMYYGGIPMIVNEMDASIKREMLHALVGETYLTDIIGRNKVKNDAELSDLFNVLASNIGTLTNPTKLSNTFKSEKNVALSPWTIKQYIDYFEDSFLLKKTIRYDIKGRKYIDTPCKYYFADMGLRNSTLDFRQVEPTHVMENIIFNDLICRGYSVDVGVIERYSKNEVDKTTRTTLEVDFVCNKDNDRLYVQSAFSIPDAEKLEQEQRSLYLIDDSFEKIILTNDNIPAHRLNSGVHVMNVCDFLLDD